MQVGQLFAVHKHERTVLFEKLECWLQATSTQVMVSLFTCRRKHVKSLAKLREELSEQPLMADHNVLGVMAASESRFPKIELNQALLDLGGCRDFQKKGPDGRVVKKATSSKVKVDLAFSRLGGDSAENIAFEHMYKGSVLLDIEVS